MLTLTAVATRDALPFPLLIDALRTMFASSCHVPPRHVHSVCRVEDAAMTSLIMPAWTDFFYGVKVVNIATGNSAHGLPGLHSSYVLHDAATGVPLAFIDGNEITARRTAAASALAASWLAPPDARHLLVVGAGKVARLLPEAHSAVRPIDQVSIWARSTVQAEALARELCGQGIRTRAVTDLADATARADIVSCATLATTPIIQGQWLRPGSHLDLIGSFTPQMREADDACFASASLFVDTDEAITKSGDLLGPLSRGVISHDTVQATLSDLVRGLHPGRRSMAERTVFKAVGTALEDLAAGILAYESSIQPAGSIH